MSRYFPLPQTVPFQMVVVVVEHLEKGPVEESGGRGPNVPPMDFP